MDAVGEDIRGNLGKALVFGCIGGMMAFGGVRQMPKKLQQRPFVPRPLFAGFLGTALAMQASYVSINASYLASLEHTSRLSQLPTPLGQSLRKMAAGHDMDSILADLGSEAAVRSLDGGDNTPVHDTEERGLSRRVGSYARAARLNEKYSLYVCVGLAHGVGESI